MAKRRRGIGGWIWALAWRCLVFLLLLLLALRFVPVPTTAFMLQSPYPVSQHWLPLDELPKWVPLAVVASEDQRFVSHWGIDVTELGNALERFDDGGGLRGASTLSQQTAKNLLLWPGRSLVRKGLEAVLAVTLEGVWGKRRILEVYLNVAEFGKGIYGVEAASRHYFGKSARYLTAGEAARLAVLLPSPRTRNPNALTPYLRQRVAWVERQMRQLGSNYLDPLLQ